MDPEYTPSERAVILIGAFVGTLAIGSLLLLGAIWILGAIVE